MILFLVWARNGQNLNISTRENQVCNVLERIHVKRLVPITTEDWNIMLSLGPSAKRALIQEDSILRNRDYELMLDIEIDKAIAKECTDHGHRRYGMAS